LSCERREEKRGCHGYTILHLSVDRNGRSNLHGRLAQGGRPENPGGTGIAGLFMPIIANLDVVPAQSKLRLNDLADAAGITPQNLSILKTGKARAIRFSTVEAIYKTLECQPADILDWRPGAAREQRFVGVDLPFGKGLCGRVIVTCSSREL
jgi:putative transcriptional regulator